jgi:hypothetical protein
MACHRREAVEQNTPDSCETRSNESLDPLTGKQTILPFFSGTVIPLRYEGFSGNEKPTVTRRRGPIEPADLNCLWQ